MVHTLYISSCQKKNFFSFPVVVNNSIKVGQGRSFGVLVINVCNHGEHYETPYIYIHMYVSNNPNSCFILGLSYLSADNSKKVTR